MICLNCEKDVSKEMRWEIKVIISLAGKINPEFVQDGKVYYCMECFMKLYEPLVKSINN